MTKENQVISIFSKEFRPVFARELWIKEDGISRTVLLRANFEKEEICLVKFTDKLRRMSYLAVAREHLDLLLALNPIDLIVFEVTGDDLLLSREEELQRDDLIRVSRGFDGDDNETYAFRRIMYEE